MEAGCEAVVSRDEPVKLRSRRVQVMGMAEHVLEDL